jgi:hypothetical protein
MRKEAERAENCRFEISNFRREILTAKNAENAKDV